MGIFDFVKEVGKKIGIGDDEPPAAEQVKKELDVHKLGTENVDVNVPSIRESTGWISSQPPLETSAPCPANVPVVSTPSPAGVPKKKPV